MSRSKKKKNKFKEPDYVKLKAANDRQQTLINCIYNYPMVITTGYPGTGKTYIPTVIAAKEFQTCNIEKIIFTRPNVPASKELGFRPGDELEKMADWTKELMLILSNSLSKNAVQSSIHNGSIEVAPLETMRGRSFKNAFIIFDEAQNATIKDMKMFVTRIGEGTTTVINGDVLQSDLDQYSGINAAIDIIEKYKMDIPIIDFKSEDIVRAELCKEWIVNWMEWEKDNK